MGALLSIFTSRKHAEVDLECKGCTCHADDKSSSSEDSAPVVQHRGPQKIDREK